MVKFLLAANQVSGYSGLDRELKLTTFGIFSSPQITLERCFCELDLSRNRRLRKSHKLSNVAKFSCLKNHVQPRAERKHIGFCPNLHRGKWAKTMRTRYGTAT